MNFLVLLLLFVISVNGEVINQQVTRTVDLTSQLTRINTKIKYVDNYHEPIGSYEYIIQPNENDYSLEFRNTNGTVLKYVRQTAKVPYKSMLVYCDCTVDENTYELSVEEVHVGSVLPKYKKKLFNESQTVIYNGNLYYYSIYKTQNYSVTYLTHTQFIYQYKNNNAILKDNMTIKLFNFSSEVVEMMKIQFDVKWSFLHVTNLEKTIDISHYGQIQIKDIVDIVNTGSIVYGSFEHLPRDFLHTHLPASANKVNIYDELGALYNYEVIDMLDYVTVQFKLRYPLLGGWKSKYILTYDLPTYACVSRIDNENFHLEIRAFDHVLNDVIVDKFQTKILLPDDAGYYKIESPFFQLKSEISHTCLSTHGRTTLVFTGHNILENHINNVVIEYVYSPLHLLRVPGKLILFCFIPFLVIIFGQRFKEFLKIHQ